MICGMPTIPHKGTKCRVTICVACVLAACAYAYAFEAEDYEEEAGLCLRVQVNPADNVYGLSFEDGTWLVNTPVFGQFFLSTYRHGKADSYYGGIGMIFRIMPHWDVAPYVGAGASYNRPMGGSANTDTPREDKPMAEAYWGGHAESGIRIWTAGRAHFFEVFGGYTLNSVNSRLDYWSAGIGYGQGW